MGCRSIGSRLRRGQLAESPPGEGSLLAIDLPQELGLFMCQGSKLPIEHSDQGHCSQARVERAARAVFVASKPGCEFPYVEDWAVWAKELIAKARNDASSMHREASVRAVASPAAARKKVRSCTVEDALPRSPQIHARELSSWRSWNVHDARDRRNRWRRSSISFCRFHFCGFYFCELYFFRMARR